MTNSKIQLTINGEPKTTSSKNLTELLQKLEVPTSYMAVALNNNVVPSSEFDNTTLTSGDQIEIIRPLAGG